MKPRFKAVTVTLPAEEFEEMDAAFRRQYAGMFYGGKLLGIQERAYILLRRDAADLLNRRPELTARATESGAQIIPFLPHRIKRNWNIPAV